MRKQIPFYKQIALYATRIKKLISKSPALKPTTKLLSSPKLLTKFAPVSPMIRHSTRVYEKTNIKTSSVLSRLAGNPSVASKVIVEEAKAKPSRGMLARHAPWIDQAKTKNSPMSPDINAEAIRLPNAVKTGNSVTLAAINTAELLKSPSLFLRGTDRDEAKDNVIYCECGNPCEVENSLCETCLKSKESVEYSGYLSIKDKSNQLKQYWYILLNKELYCISRHE